MSNVDRLAEALTAARRPEQERLTDAMLVEGFLGVLGEAQVGKTTLCRQAEAELTVRELARVVYVDVIGAYSIAKLIARWRHSLLRAAVGRIALSHAQTLDRDFWPSTTQRKMLDARARFGDSFVAALNEQPAKTDRPRDFAEPIALSARLAERSSVPWILLFDHLHAPLLIHRHPIDPFDLLWQLRSAAQHLPQLHVVITCAPGAEHLAAGPKAAFYGDGTWLHIDAPTTEQWDQAHIQTGKLLDLEWIRISQRHVPTTLAMLHEREAGVRDGRDAFRSVARRQDEHANRCLLHASSLHRLGAHVLASIASGNGPYAGTPEARSDDVAAAAKALRLAGLIRRDPDVERGWLLTDPAIGSLLADPSGIQPGQPNSELRDAPL